MKNSSNILNHSIILEARDIFLKGKNITTFLKEKLNTDENSSALIELSYELQSGSYIKNYHNDPRFLNLYIKEISEIVNNKISKNCSILDVGCGELTTLSLLLKSLKIKPKRLYALDLSWSRIYIGLNFAKSILSSSDYKKIIPMISDISEIPFADKSIDFTITNFALYSSHGKLDTLLTELFRVSNNVILFEPFYEIASIEGQRRMDKLGYIRNIEQIINKLGGAITEKIILSNNANELTPAACFIIKPNSHIENSDSKSKSKVEFTIPGSNFLLTKQDNFYISLDTGIIFPIVKKIPIFKNKTSLLATCLSNWGK